LPFIAYRIICSIAFVAIHALYFKGGDTFVYFDLGDFYADQIRLNPVNVLGIYASDFETLRNIKMSSSYYSIFYLKAPDAMLMGKIIGIINVFTGSQFMSSTIIFSMICSIGLWQIFQTVSEIYPSLRKYFAIGILYYPTIAIWSSGMLKDPLAMLAVGLIFRSTYMLFKKKRVLFSIITILISILLCQALKPYILYIFIPTMLLWIYGMLAKSIKRNFIKSLILPIIILSFVTGGYFLFDKISAGAGKYSLDNIEDVAKGFHNWHKYLAETRNQSGYTLGEVEFTPIGILSKAPAAIFVTYFRPIPFVDTRNASTFFESIQSFVLLIISIWVLFKAGVLRTFRLIISNVHVRAFIIFAIFFGFAVGFTSYNFGALSRYKIPALPFYVVSLAIIYYEARKKRKLKQA
tara:strand:- start:710 stop:1930 length:1221 start_codon:yes stop_codon:yes gene_type:complete